MLRIFLYSFSWVLFVVLPIHIVAQTSINSTQYIQTQLQKLSSFEKESGMGAAAPTTFKPSWLKDMDIRTETRDFDWEQQEYMVRLSPSSRKIRAAQIQLQESIIAKFQQEDNSYYQEIIERSYDHWLDLYETHLQLQANTSLLLVYEDIETVLNRLAVYSKVKAKDIIDTQRELLETKENIQRMEWKLGNSIEGAVPTFEDMISVNDLKRLMDKLPAISIDDRTVLPKVDVRKNMLSAEIALEEAEAQSIFDFFQIKYNGPHEDGLNERISIGAGLKIPFSSDRTIKLEELKLEKALLDKEQAMDQYIQQELLKQKEKEFFQAFQEMNIHQELYAGQERKMNQLIGQLMQTEEADPLLPLYQQVAFWKQRLEVIKMEMRIYKIYVAYLETKGSIYHLPFTNYLTSINN